MRVRGSPGRRQERPASPTRVGVDAKGALQGAHEGAGGEKIALAKADEVEVDGDGVAFRGIDVDGSGVRGKRIGGELEFEGGTPPDAGAAAPATVVCIAGKVDPKNTPLNSNQQNHSYAGLCLK